MKKKQVLVIIAAALLSLLLLVAGYGYGARDVVAPKKGGKRLQLWMMAVDREGYIKAPTNHAAIIDDSVRVIRVSRINWARRSGEEALFTCKIAGKTEKKFFVELPPDLVQQTTAAATIPSSSPPPSRDIRSESTQPGLILLVKQWKKWAATASGRLVIVVESGQWADFSDVGWVDKSGDPL